MKNSTPSWQTISKKEIYDNPWISLEEHLVINPSGGQGIYGKVHFKNAAIGIVALDEEGEIYLVGQQRYVLNEWSWEIPEGGGWLGTDPLENAKRELQEETGLMANKWRLLLRTHLSNSVSDEEGFIYLAQELTPGKRQPEATEADMKTWKLPLAEALKMIDDGKITDSLTVMGLLKADAMRRAKAL